VFSITLQLVMMRRLLAFLAVAMGAGMARADDDCGQCVNSPTDRQCWDGPWGNFDINTDYYQKTPDTGKIVEVIALKFGEAYV
jgi:hypothetical protein